MTGNSASESSPRRLGDGLLSAARTLEPDELREIDVDHLRPVVARDVDLGRRRAADRLLDHAVEHLGHAGRIAHLLLVADHVLEQLHLLDLLEAALTDGAVGRLRGDQQERGVVPVGGLDRGDEVGDAGPVLGDGHRHPTGGTRVAVGHHAGVALVGAVPERDAGIREEVRDRHHGRADDAEGVLDAVHLEHLHEGLLGSHLHRMRGLSSAGGSSRRAYWRAEVAAAASGEERIAPAVRAAARTRARLTPIAAASRADANRGGRRLLPTAP